MASSYSKKYMVVFETLKAEILSNQLSPNTPLIELDICERFGMSRTPVRQALQELERHGLVEYIPNKGMFVSQLKIMDVLEIYRIRELLDPLALEIAHDDSPNHLLQTLQTTLAQQKKYIADKAYQDYLNADMEFHKAYSCNNPNHRLGEFLGQLIDDSRRFSSYAYGDLARAKISIEQHQEIVSALERNDISAAKEAAQMHMVRVREYFKSKL